MEFYSKRIILLTSTKRRILLKAKDTSRTSAMRREGTWQLGFDSLVESALLRGAKS